MFLMFTGIIQHVGRVVRSVSSADGIRIDIDLGPLGESTGLGASVAVNGACLTVSSLDGSIAGFDVSAETLSRTTLGKLRSGDAVNLERALRADSRMGGHFVQGHIDGVGRIRNIKRKGNDWTFEFSIAGDLLAQVVEKGSLAVDGISLTAAAVTPGGFTAAVIRQTFENTTLGGKKAGDEVNIETDILGKYVRRLLSGMREGNSNITRDFLQKHGF